MKKLLFFLLPLYVLHAQQENSPNILFFQTNWGNTLSWDSFCKKAKDSGYDGIEIWMPSGTEEQEELREALEKHDLKLGLMCGSARGVSNKSTLENFAQNLKALLSWDPVYINCHTGSDFFTFEQNAALIILANEVSKKNNIPIYHETHRGRFSYNLNDTKKFVQAIPELKLTLDISHWMVVHESLLHNMDEELEEIINRTNHIHARVGHAQGPQVSDPEAPEWKDAVERHLAIWEKVIRKISSEGDRPVTISTEFGPPNYLPALPYTKLPVSDQWKANVFIKEAIKERIQGSIE